MTANEDRILREVGALAAEQQRFEGEEALLRDYCEGRLSPAEVEKLEQRAVEDSEFQQRFEAYRPLGVSARAGIADVLVRLQQDEAAASVRERASVGSGLAQWRAWLERLRWYSLPAAAAVALLIWWLLPVGPDGGPALPAYDISARGGIRQVRGEAEQEIAKLAAGSELELTLRPSTAVEGKLAVAVFVVTPEGSQPVAAHAQLAASGAARLIIARSAFGDLSGIVRLRVVIGRPERLQSAAELASASATAGPGWRRLELRVDLL